MYYVDANRLMNGVLLALLGVAALVFVVTLFAAWRGKRGRVMSYLYMFTALFGTFAVGVAALGFRGQKSDSRPWHFFLDMKYQAKYTSQGQSKYFADGRSSRLPPTDTVPFDGTDYAADAGAHTAPNPDFLKADKRYYFGIANADEKETVNGVEVPARPKWVRALWFTVLMEGYYANNLPPAAVERAGGWEPLMKRGQVQFNRHCAVCHGQSGRGGTGELAYGIVGSYGLSTPPADLIDPRKAPFAASQPDGQLYNTVVNGRGTMPGYGHQIKDPLDRWAIVAHMRLLQYATNGPTAEKK